MCGITGKIFLDSSKEVSIASLKKMANSIHHRGPDDDGYFVQSNVGLGFKRLSIIDLKKGHQPLQGNSGKTWITYNGEVYNFKALRQELESQGYNFKTNTDTEVVVNLYEAYGERCVNHLRGMFSFVIWDEHKKRLFGARDRLGIKPFHYYLDYEKFVWASELKSILKCDNVAKSIDYNALDCYFTYNYIHGDQSIFNEIKKLPAAHYFTFDPFANQKLNIQRYWSLDISPDYSKSEAYWKEAMYDVLSESVKLRMISDVPLGAFLSGGIDSSTVVALMSLASDQPINTFSIGFKEQRFNELDFARQVADKYNTNHHELIVEPESVELLPKLVGSFDEPFADSSAIPTYYVSKFAREHVTVALSGDGGDEIFAGYNSYPKISQLHKLKLNTHFMNSIASGIDYFMPAHMRGKNMIQYLSKNKKYLGAYLCLWQARERHKLYNEDVLGKLGGYRAEKLKVDLLDQFEGDFITKVQQLDIQSYMVDDILTKVDRMSMLNSLEVRVPLLDHKFVELGFKIPTSMKLRGKMKKFILKEAFKDKLPHEVISHKKQGFAVPLNSWFKGNLKEYVFDTLMDSRHLYDFLDKRSVRQVLHNSQKGSRDLSQKIWSLLFLNEWLTQNNS